LRPRVNGQNIRYNIREQQNDMNKAGTTDKINLSRGDQCHECKGYGHTMTECATFLKKQKKSFNGSWLDEGGLDRNTDNIFTKQVTAMTGRISSDTETRKEESTYDELVVLYNSLSVRSTDIFQELEEQKKINGQLLAERGNHLANISELNNEVRLLNSQLENFKSNGQLALISWMIS
jgi:hypothetical protein